MKGETEQAGQGLDPQQAISMAFWDDFSKDDQQIYFKAYSKKCNASDSILLGSALACDDYIEFNSKIYQ
ncbi:MAG: hypothetical protein K2Z81_10545 [Cyanobacteria bacterium]|nr:hypothetical protein [Cyanobacteriota bacterium]